MKLSFCRFNTHAVRTFASSLWPSGEYANGQPFFWETRKHQLGLSLARSFEGSKRLRPFAWLNPAPFFRRSHLACVSWCSAVLLLLGASMFSFSNAAQVFPKVLPSLAR